MFLHKVSFCGKGEVERRSLPSLGGEKKGEKNSEHSGILRSAQRSHNTFPTRFISPLLLLLSLGARLAKKMRVPLYRKAALIRSEHFFSRILPLQQTNDLFKLFHRLKITLRTCALESSFLCNLVKDL